MGTSPLPCTPNIHPRSNSPSLPACCLPASTPSLVGSPHCSSFRIAKTDGWPWLRGAASKKLNENKMANRCAMRQRPSPNEKCQSQPRPHALTPCEIIRVLLLLAPPVAVAASAASPGAACAVAAEPGILSFGPMPICPSHILIHTPPPPPAAHIYKGLPACLPTTVWAPDELRLLPAHPNCRIQGRSQQQDCSSMQQQVGSSPCLMTSTRRRSAARAALLNPDMESPPAFSPSPPP